jgi:hypothetical protein
VALSAAVLLMHKLSLFEKVIRERLLMVRLPSESDYEEVFAKVFRKHLEEFNLISIETLSEAELQEAIYSVVLRTNVNPNDFLEAVRKVNGGNKVSLVLGQQEIDL